MRASPRCTSVSQTLLQTRLPCLAHTPETTQYKSRYSVYGFVKTCTLRAKFVQRLLRFTSLCDLDVHSLVSSSLISHPWMIGFVNNFDALRLSDHM